MVDCYQLHALASETHILEEEVAHLVSGAVDFVDFGVGLVPDAFVAKDIDHLSCELSMEVEELARVARHEVGRPVAHAREGVQLR